MHVLRRRAVRLLAGVAIVVAACLTVPAPASAAGPTQTYLVLFKGSSSPADAAAIVGRAGGSVVADYAEIGVLVARSDSASFAATVRADDAVEGAAPTANSATRLAVPAQLEGSGRPAGDLPNAPATDADTFSPRLLVRHRLLRGPHRFAERGPAAVPGQRPHVLVRQRGGGRARSSDAPDVEPLTDGGGAGR